MKPHVLFVAVGLGLASAVSACAGAENAAARDPMKCERDPSCARARASYTDCTRQCVDDPECVNRCEQMQRHTDGLGR
jgi:hypothetical protein